MLRLYVLMDDAGVFLIVSYRELDPPSSGSLRLVREYPDDDDGAALLGRELRRLRLAMCRGAAVTV